MINPKEGCLALLLCLTEASAVAQTGDDVNAPTTTSVVSEPLATIPADVPASPADESVPEKAASPKSRFIEEIVVTAQRREENLQDVPISVQAFSAEALDARGVTDTQTLVNVTPGLSIGAVAGYNVTYLRGVGADGFITADPSVALYIDGVYYPFSRGQVQNFGAVERVEVLKGPQGTLFGRNANGGAINVITRDPSFDKEEVSIASGYGTNNDWQNRAFVSVPLTDTLAFSVSGQYSHSDYIHENSRAAGEPLPDEVSRGGRLKIRWAPMENLDIVVAGLRVLQSGTGTEFAINSDPAPAFAALIQPQTGRTGTTDSRGYFSNDETLLYGSAKLKLDVFDVKLLGSDQKVQGIGGTDFDASPTPLAYFTVPSQFSDVQTAELQILSNATSWNAEKLSWIAGAYYYTGSAGLNPVTFGVGPTLIGQLSTALNDAGVLQPLGLPALALGDTLVAHGVLDTDSVSGYGQATYRFADWVALTLGLRYSVEKRAIANSDGQIGLVSGGLTAPYTQYGPELNTKTTRSLKPKVTIDFHPWDGGLVYATYQEAEKSATFNTINFLRFSTLKPELDVVRPEELRAYEVGVKTDFLDGNIRFDAAVFQYDIKNLQTQFISLQAGGSVTFENAPKSQIRGFEFGTTAQILPSLLNGLVAEVSGAFLDSEFKKYPNAQGFDSVTRLFSNSNDFTGNDTPRAPKFSGTASLSQTLSVPGGSLEIAADYYYNSGFYYLAQNDPFDREKAYGLFGGRISYLYEPWKLRITAFGKNLLDEHYNISRFVTDFGVGDAPAAGATYGARFNWDF